MITGPFISKTHSSIRGVIVFIPSVDRNFTLLVPETVVCEGIKSPATEYSPIAPIDREISSPLLTQYFPPANPIPRARIVPVVGAIKSNIAIDEESFAIIRPHLDTVVVLPLSYSALAYNAVSTDPTT